MKKTYSNKLKHPKWQKKRLQVLQRDNFACVKCKDTETELHVNHLKYTGEPYDAPLSDLETLCKYCHQIHHAMPDYVILEVHRELDPFYNLIYCIKYKLYRRGSYVFAHITNEDKIEFISDYHIVHRDNMNYALIYKYGISVDFLDSELDFYDFGGIDTFAYEFNHEIKNSEFKKSKEVWITRTSHSFAHECFSVKKSAGIYKLKYNGGAS